jgi:SET domain
MDLRFDQPPDRVASVDITAGSSEAPSKAAEVAAAPPAGSITTADNSSAPAASAPKIKLKLKVGSSALVSAQPAAPKSANAAEPTPASAITTGSSLTQTDNAEPPKQPETKPSVPVKKHNAGDDDDGEAEWDPFDDDDAFVAPVAPPPVPTFFAVPKIAGATRSGGAYTVSGQIEELPEVLREEPATSSSSSSSSSSAAPLPAPPNPLAFNALSALQQLEALQKEIAERRAKLKELESKEAASLAAGEAGDAAEGEEQQEQHAGKKRRRTVTKEEQRQEENEEAEAEKLDDKEDGESDGQDEAASGTKSKRRRISTTEKPLKEQTNSTAASTTATAAPSGSKAPAAINTTTATAHKSAAKFPSKGAGNFLKDTPTSSSASASFKPKAKSSSSVAAATASTAAASTKKATTPRNHGSATTSLGPPNDPSKAWDDSGNPEIQPGEDGRVIRLFELPWLDSASERGKGGKKKKGHSSSSALDGIGSENHPSLLGSNSFSTVEEAQRSLAYSVSEGPMVQCECCIARRLAIMKKMRLIAPVEAAAIERAKIAGGVGTAATVAAMPALMTPTASSTTAAAGAGASSSNASNRLGSPERPSTSASSSGAGAVGTGPIMSVAEARREAANNTFVAAIRRAWGSSKSSYDEDKAKESHGFGKVAGYYRHPLLDAGLPPSALTASKSSSAAAAAGDKKKGAKKAEAAVAATTVLPNDAAASTTTTECNQQEEDDKRALRKVADEIFNRRATIKWSDGHNSTSMAIAAAGVTGAFNGPSGSGNGSGLSSSGSSGGAAASAAFLRLRDNDEDESDFDGDTESPEERENRLLLKAMRFDVAAVLVCGPEEVQPYLPKAKRGGASSSSSSSNAAGEVARKSARVPKPKKLDEDFVADPMADPTTAPATTAAATAAMNGEEGEEEGGAGEKQDAAKEPQSAVESEQKTDDAKTKEGQEMPIEPAAAPATADAAASSSAATDVDDASAPSSSSSSSQQQQHQEEPPSAPASSSVAPQADAGAPAVGGESSSSSSSSAPAASADVPLLAAAAPAPAPAPAPVPVPSPALNHGKSRSASAAASAAVAKSAAASSSAAAAAVVKKGSRSRSKGGAGDDSKEGSKGQSATPTPAKILFVDISSVIPFPESIDTPSIGVTPTNADSSSNANGGSAAEDGSSSGTAATSTAVVPAAPTGIAAGRVTRGSVLNSALATGSSSHAGALLFSVEDALEHLLRIDYTAPHIIRDVPGRGRCVYAAGFIPKGAFVVEYGGQLITQKEAQRREKLYQKEALGSYMFYFEHNGQTHCVDGTAERKEYGIGRLINHSRKNPNLTPKKIVVDGIPRIALLAKRQITYGEELAYDYGERDSQALKVFTWLKA